MPASPTPPPPLPPATGPAPDSASGAIYVATVLRAGDLCVVSGANMGDAMPLPADSICGDYYRLSEHAPRRALALALTSPGEAAGRVAPGSEVGEPGAAVIMAGTLSLMATDGDRVEVLVLDLAGERLALPLSPLVSRHDYVLIAANDAPAEIRLADTVAGAFARGTRIALADGRLAPVEMLEPGDGVITRDHGVQRLRWKGSVRLRADGAHAPVVLQPGVLGNLGALTVSPHHRLFLYRPQGKQLAGAAELLVQARHLVDGRAILRREGGHVEYFSLVFDDHEVIYAEGIPCESLMVCPSVLSRLPEDLAVPLREALPALNHRLHTGADLAPELVSLLRDRPEPPSVASR